MNPIVFALRRPLTVIVVIIAIAIACFFAIRPKSVDAALQKVGIELPIKRMAVDIFPSLNLPVIYVAQPYGGMDPAQMEGMLTNYYEYHFLYISGIHHVESKNVQGLALMKLYFHPGTDMSQAMAETINYVNRSQAFMPPGTVSPFVMRFDTGSVPVGYLVLSSETKTIAEIQDQALFKVRPMFAALPGVSAPPPFGGNQRTIVVRADPDRLLAYNMSPDEVISALNTGNAISPSGNIHVGDMYPIVPTNAVVKDIQDLGNIPIRKGTLPTIRVRDVATIVDAADIATGYTLVNGRRAVYILATKRADASTMSVIDEIKQALPSMQKELPDDIQVKFEFDQSGYVSRSIQSLLTEALLGAVLTGLMVILFLRDWRSALVVIVNIPLAIMTSVVCLWMTNQTINLMTLGGLALAVGILVDEATVEIENIHTQMAHTSSVARAVRLGNMQTAVPRLLAMLCILAVFIPSFFMQGAARAMFVPLSLAVGFSMLASYVLSSTFVPVLSTWLLKQIDHQDSTKAGWFSMDRLRVLHERIIRPLVTVPLLVIAIYLGTAGAAIFLISRHLGMEIFPVVDAGEFRLRLRAPNGTHIDRTEQITLEVIKIIRDQIGAENIELTLGYVGSIPSTYPINAVYQFSRGPEEAFIRVALKRGSGVRTEPAKEALRRELSSRMPDIRFSFEPADIVSEVMSFGSPTPIEIAVRGANLTHDREYITKIQSKLAELKGLRDVQISQSLDYPTINVQIDREKAGISGTTVSQVVRSVVAATSSSRFVVRNFWADAKSGIGYQVQVEIPQPVMNSVTDLQTVPVERAGSRQLLLRDVASVSNSTMTGQYDRYNMKRELSLTANIGGEDMGTVSRKVAKILADLEKSGEKPATVTTEIRGQIPPMYQMISGLGVGLALAVVVIFLLLSANFQSISLAVITVSTAPAVIVGVLISLAITGSHMNIQSFIGSIMAIGVAMANAILLVTFAEENRRKGESAVDAAVKGATSRLRPILMRTN